MNIPEITKDMKQGLRSENVTPLARVPDEPPKTPDTKASLDAVQTADKTSQDKRSKAQSKEQVMRMVADVQEHLESNNVKLKFNVIEESNTVQVELQDGDGKTIKKIPGDDLVKLSKSLKNMARGILDERF